MLNLGAPPVTKTRLKGAQTGHSLLKKKSDALNKVGLFAAPIPHA